MVDSSPLTLTVALPLTAHVLATICSLNSAIVVVVDHPPLHCHHAPDCGTKGPYCVMKDREWLDWTEQGPPLKVESPLTVIVMAVAPIAGSEYSTENVSSIVPEY